MFEQLRIDAEASAVEVSDFRAHPITAGEEIHVPFRWIAPEPQAHQRAQAIEALCACRWARRTRTPSLGGHGTIATAAAAARRRRCRGLPRADLRLFSSVLCKLVILYDDAAAIRTRNNELPAERARVEVLLTDWQKLAKRGDVDAVILADTTPSAVAKRSLALAMHKFIEKHGVCIARPLSMSIPAESASPLDSMKCRVD